MATYASATNPFVKSIPTTNNGIDKQSNKLSPGTAVPHNLVDTTSKHKKPATTEEPSDGDDLCDVNSNTLAEEIKEASLSLVESVIRLELEEKSKDDQLGENAELQVENDELINGKKKLSVVTEEEEDEEDETEVDAEAAPPMEQDGRQHQHIELIRKLRLQLRDLEKYAFERGELEQAPPSIMAERQSVILETLRDRLSLNIGKNEIETLKLDELKKQVDQEIQELLGPLMTKEYLLNQFRTQLTDLERYIAHLHATLGKMHDKRGCLCHVHGCSSPSQAGKESNYFSKGSSIMNNEALPKTSRLIRSLVTQLICSDMKLQESARKEQAFERISNPEDKSDNSKDKEVGTSNKAQQFKNDDAAWLLHIDKVILATDSLVNLFNLEPQHQRNTDKPLDEIVESVVRRQLVPALRDLLSYGLIDPDHLPRSTSYVSLLFDPYFLLSTLTCFPSSQKSNSNGLNPDVDKVHVWYVIEEYYKSRNETGFKTSSVKTLSQSFDLAPSISGPIKITSKQALLIAIEDIIETLSKCRPNGPESHFRAFIYNSLNRSKLTTWLRLIFTNKSITRKYYHNFSFVSQTDKMNKLLTTIDALNQFEFKLRADLESIEQFVSAF